MAKRRVSTWADEGYKPTYNFAFDSEGSDSGRAKLYERIPRDPSLGVDEYGKFPDINGSVVDLEYPERQNQDPVYQNDLRRWLTAATGEPGTGWALGDNAGDGQGFWGSFLESLPFLIAGGTLAAGLAGGLGVAGGLGAEAIASPTALGLGEGFLGASVGAGELGLGAGAGAGTAAGLAAAEGGAAAGGLLGTGLTAGQALTGAGALGTLGSAGLALGGGGGGVETIQSPTPGLDATPGTVPNQSTLNAAFVPVPSAGGFGLGDAATAAGAVGTLASAGATIASGIAQSNALGDQADLAERQAQVAEAIFAQSGPLRGLSYQQLQEFLQGGQVPPGLQGEPPQNYGLDEFLTSGTLPTAVQPRALPPVPGAQDVTAYSRDVLERQFGRAREATIAGAPARGGRLASALTDLEGERALGVTDIYTQQKEREFAQQQAQHAQDVGSLQRQDTLAGNLFGVGLDTSREASQQDDLLRRNLFAAALGVGQNNASTALQGLAGSSASFGSLASGRLGQTNQLADLTGTLAGFFAPGLAKKPGTNGFLG